MTEKQTKENTVHTNLRIGKSDYDKIKKIADENERTVSQQIRLILKKYLEMME